MTQKAWTVDLQKKWLEAQLSTFCEAQAQKTVMKQFFPKILKAWKEEWPIPLPTDEEVAEVGSLEKAKAVKIKSQKMVCDLLNWYSEH